VDDEKKNVGEVEREKSDSGHMYIYIDIDRYAALSSASTLLSERE
jgi:hypothetical protein